ncbi:Phenazine biosynthesis protein PhzF like [hydrothermal vent metagenome]|uniref:Phenazine biosynthesis protein PhzF like n=1 Tax=hydrothermal vent metagenome TaxID=652676 RepID=A0A3B0TQS5_9ZZZZ
MGLTFHTLDVFTQNRYAGNPLAVVLDADALMPEQMQAIAAEFNLSETVFVMAPENPAHSARLKIFTPTHELPFAGHPTVGTAILLAGLKHGETAAHEALLVLEEGVGPVRVGVVIRPGEAAYAEFDLPKMPRELDPPGDREAVARAIGLIGSDIGFDNHRPTNFSAGVPFAMVPVRDGEVLARSTPVAGLWKGAGFASPNHPNAFVYTRQTGNPDHAFRARMFAPEMGIFEDPATGGAVAALAGALEKFESLATGRHILPVEQGVEMGRPSLITLEVEVEAGQLKTARIGGHAVRVTQGNLVA